MTDTDFDFLALRETRTCADGKHRYDPEGKRKLIEACRRPGASLAGLALKAGVNANQLRKWVQLQERREGTAFSHDAIPQASPAFVPVVMIDDSPASTPAQTARDPRSHRCNGSHPVRRHERHRWHACRRRCPTASCSSSNALGETPRWSRR